MKIGVTKHILFTPDGFMYRTHFCFHMLCSYLVYSGNTHCSSGQREASDVCSGTSGRSRSGDWPQGWDKINSDQNNKETSLISQTVPGFEA